jgi:hypothetical protein
MSPRGGLNLENRRAFMAMQRAIEVKKGGLSSDFGFLTTLPRFAIPWSSAVEAPTKLTPMVPPQQSKLLLLASHQSHITGPAPANFSKSPAKPYVISEPLPNDILLGRGKPIQGRPANVRFREMIDKHMEKYYDDKGGKGDKVVVSAYIVHLVKEEGGRFLMELENGGWVEVDEARARAKVSRAFRSRRPVFQATTLKKEKRTA